MKFTFKAIISIFVFSLVIFTLIGCDNPFMINPEEIAEFAPFTITPEKIPEGYGMVQISLNQGSARTLIPELTLLNIHRFEYLFSKDGNAPQELTPQGDLFILEPGTYTLTVSAYVNENADSLAARGSTEVPFTITEGEITTSVAVTLRPYITGEGTGSFEATIFYPPGASITELTLSRIAGDENYDLLTEADVIEEGAIFFNAMVHNVPVGYYLLSVKVKNAGGVFTGRSDIVHIYQNLKTKTDEQDFTFYEDDFRIFLVTNTNDSGPGSLRQLLTEAPVGQLIRVMLEPGSVIELESALPPINRSLIIEGNGLVITRSNLWTATSDSSQLLRVSSSSAAVKISRVHFKDGRATDQGAAIYNVGNLSLETCIFSGNRTIGGGAYGGAIYSSGSLDVKACTFYGNEAARANYGSGGAIFTSGSNSVLFLTGNLFFGNTAHEKPVVSRAGGTVISGGFNAVDIPFGTGSAYSGWSWAAGDKQIYELPVSPLTFRSISGSEAIGVITALPLGYPTKDFYGDETNDDAAAGAVQSIADGSGYFLNLIDKSTMGSVTIDNPNEDGLYTNVTLTANVKPGYSFSHWLRDGINIGDINPLNLTLDDNTTIQAAFAMTVTNFNDEAGSANNVTLRYALNNVQDGDVITLSNVIPGETVIALNSALPEITKSIMIEGNGITITRSASWTEINGTSQFLRISSSSTVKISRVHFKDGRATYDSYYDGWIGRTISGGAIYNNGALTLEACIFSGNQAYYGGAIFNTGNLNIAACTFYGNSSTSNYGGAIYTTEYQSKLTLTGNLFFGNTARYGLAVYPEYIDDYYGEGWYSGYAVVVSNGYNVVDVPLGQAGYYYSGWTAATGDKQINEPPVSSLSFRLLPESEAESVVTALPSVYPLKDFYGSDISNGAAAGAVQSAVSDGYVINLLNPIGNGNVIIDTPPNTDGVYNGNVILMANGTHGFTFLHWLKDGSNIGNDNPLHLTIDANTTIQAVFIVVITSLIDEPGSADNVTLRYAINNAQSGATITFAEGLVIPGESVIDLNGSLSITKSLTIEGNGVTLAKASISIGSSSSTVVKISRVHFKGSIYNSEGVAIVNSSGNLTLESCIFSNKWTNSAFANGGAISNNGTLTVRACTFINNRTGSSGYGGAIYHSSGTLSLTGNVFFGNAASTTWADRGPVVYWGGGTVISRGYNVVDVPLGTGGSQSGWDGAYGDKVIDDLPVSLLSFGPIPGRGAVDVVSTLPVDYPTKDFYGNPITNEAAAGAVQSSGVSGYYHLYIADPRGRGAVTIANPNRDGIYTDVTITVSATTGYEFSHWIKDGINAGTANPWSFTLTDHTNVQAIFKLVVTDLSDTEGSIENVTLRYALNIAQDDDIITFNDVTPGESVIALRSVLPQITKNITIDGNGVTLTRSNSWTEINSTSQLLRINNYNASVKINRVHFKNGRVAGSGGAIYNNSNLSLEACIFNGNKTIFGYDDYSYNANGGAIYNAGKLTVKACTFYGNNADGTDTYGGAIYTSGGNGLTLTGNLFFGNNAFNGPVVYYGSSYYTTSGGYNVVDVSLGTGTGNAGWTAQSTDKQINTLPVSLLSFRPLSGSEAVNVITALPAEYPTKDFYGNNITAGAAAGAVQSTASGGYYLDLMNPIGQGTVSINNPNPDMLYSGTVTLTADANPGYVFSHWLKDGVNAGSSNPWDLTLNSHTTVQAVFIKNVEITNLSNSAGSATNVTLRYALATAQDGDIIRFAEGLVIPGESEIVLGSVLPEITKNIVIDGNGVTLTPSSSWVTSDTSQLLRISSSAIVTINRMHFKEGKANTNGGAIYNNGNLTLESCIFSGNQVNGNYHSNGGAIFNSGKLTVKACTFYQNSAATKNTENPYYYGSGGAIYAGGNSSSSVILTGNLFFNNTAGYNRGAVVYKDGGSVTSGGYNVVNIALGTENSQSGWTAATGDRYIQIPTVSGKYHLLLSNSGAANVLTALPSGYPAKDFYGNNINNGAAAGAVQSFVSGSGYFLNILEDHRGTITVSNNAPDQEGLYTGTVTLTASPNIGYGLAYWLKDGINVGSSDSLNLTMTSHTNVKPVFAFLVTILSDSTGAGSLRYALTNAQHGELIRFVDGLVTPGESVITLNSNLEINRSVTIDGDGVILTNRKLEIRSSTTVVKINRVYFRNFSAEDFGGAISNYGNLTLESCIFNNCRAYGIPVRNSNGEISNYAYNNGGAIYNPGGTLTVKACTFYNNRAVARSLNDIYYNGRGGAIYITNYNTTSTVTLIGNLFYGNVAERRISNTTLLTDGDGPVVYRYSGTITSSGYNLADYTIGTATTQSGWSPATGDNTFSALGINGTPINTTTFAPNSSALNIVPAGLDMPVTDFYGNTRTWPGAPGAVHN